MKSRCARVVLLMLLATIAVDVADGDCVEAACAGPASDCACCVLSEPAAKDAHLPSSHLRTRILPAHPDQPREGVRPIPYRPPLSLS
jgi:hypothetical protein